MSENKKRARKLPLNKWEKQFTGSRAYNICNVHFAQFQPRKFCRGGFKSILCRKYLRTVFSVFHKIYAHKWLYTAVCGHKIFLVTFSWRRRWDSNPPATFINPHCKSIYFYMCCILCCINRSFCSRSCCAYCSIAEGKVC